MWYSSGGWRIGYATSTDRVNWTKRPEPVLQLGPAGDWDDSRIRVRTVIREANRQYKMWYTGGSGNAVTLGSQTGLATSSDRINWVKYDDPATTDKPFANSDPVLEAGAPRDFQFKYKCWAMDAYCGSL